MKTTLRILKITAIASVLAVGLIFTFSKCRKDIVVVPVPIHDTLFGKTISGIAQYPDYSGAMQLAKGAAISLYSGSSKSGNAVATCFADSSGSYSFPYLLPGNYFIWAKYNTKNQNYEKTPIEGINFETVPGYPVVMASSNISQNISLATVASTGTLKISIVAADTTGSMGSIKYAAAESHSKASFEIRHLDDQDPYATVIGGFNVFKLTEFYFDESAPANTRFKGYVLVSTLNTLEPGRDAVGACASAALGVDTYKVGTTAYVLAQSDTAYYYATAGNVENYGKGFLAHGTLEAKYKHQGGEIVAPRVTPLTPDTILGYNGPWGVRTAKTENMYFEYLGKKKVWNSAGTTFNWYFEFEGNFNFNRKDFYINHGLGNEVKVFSHVQLKGTNNVEY